jgi:hypothetical protein
MKFRNRLGVVIAVVLVAVGGLVFVGVQNAKAADIDGTASNITSTSMTIGNKTLVIDGNTEIVGQMVTGSVVQIRARVQDDGTLLATRIVVKNSDDGHDDNDEIEGIIQSIGANNSSIVINGHTILIDEHTRIDDGHLTVNARAEVEVVTQQDGSLLATEIEIEDDDDNEDDEDDNDDEEDDD